MTRQLRIVAGFLACAAALAAGPAAAQAPVELELVLAVDSSGSVSDKEFDLQTLGTAAAFRDPAVIAAIERLGGNGIVVAVVQWSSPGHQVLALDWTAVRDAASAARLAQRIERTPRLILGETAIDGALKFSSRLIAGNGYEGRRKAIDVSGDGRSNWGGRPNRARDQAVAARITVNGLAILNEQHDLADYYRRYVIGGPGAFVLSADDYGDFARAMRLKLLQEIAGAPIVRAPNRAPPGARRYFAFAGGLD